MTMLAGPQGGGPPPPAANTVTLGIFRAEDYGAHSIQAGATDASGGINIAASIAAAQGGGLVMLDPGLTYPVRRTVTLPANVELAIPTGTVLQAAAGLVGDVVTATNAAGVRISGGGTIDANRAIGTTGNGVTLTGCTEPQVEEIAIINAWQDDVALVNCVRPVLDVFVGASGRHGLYHSGTTFGRGQVTARDNGQRIAGHGVVFDAASTDNCYGPLVSTDSRVGGAKTQQYGVFEVPASGCDRNTYAPSALGGNAVGSQSLVGASSGPVVIAPNSISAGMLANGSVGDVAIAAAGLSNSSLNATVARANQLINGNFQVWQRGTGPFSANAAYGPDRWQIGLAGSDAITVSRDTTHVDVGATYACHVTFTLGTGGGASGLFQYLKAGDGYALPGEPFAASLRVYCDTANAVRLSLTSDGTGGAPVYSAFNNVTNGWQTLTVAIPALPANVGQLQLSIYFAASCNAWFNHACVVQGTVAANDVPLTPAEDLARCLRYYQRFGPSAQVFAAGQAYNTSGGAIPFPLVAPMGGNPTLTVSALSDVGLTNAAGSGVACTSLSIDVPHNWHPRLNAGLGSAPLVAGNATQLCYMSSSVWIAFEWNP